jgi:radical SAM protein with 4Fe4S-binding SPASM domain
MSGEKYIPINKGHFELDTRERHDAFQEKMSFGWEEEYKEYRRLWEELPKRREIRDYPLLVDLELSSICNLKCPMCYTITDEFKQKVKKGLMDFDLFKKVVDEIVGKVPALRLSLRGEPTLHPQFIESIAYAKSRGIQEVSSLTNGSKVTPEFFRQIAEAGLDWLTISVDGTDEEYENIRKPLKFSDTLQKLKYIKQYKDSNKFVKPVIKVQGIWPAIRPNPTRYYETLAPFTDLIAYNPLIDYLRKDSEIVYEENFACPQLYQRLVIGSDGKVMMCSNDEDSEMIIGNAYEQSVYEIWHSKKLNGIRKIHNQRDGFKTMHVCRACYYPRKAVPDERAMVGKREIWIENYVNRKQEVGE